MQPFTTISIPSPNRDQMSADGVRSGTLRAGGGEADENDAGTKVEEVEGRENPLPPANATDMGLEVGMYTASSIRVCVCQCVGALQRGGVGQAYAAGEHPSLLVE
jgi:hypothetical protein